MSRKLTNYAEYCIVRDRVVEAALEWVRVEGKYYGDPINVHAKDLWDAVDSLNALAAPAKEASDGR